MTDLEDLVRDTFAARERGVAAPDSLATAARSRAKSQRRDLAAAVLAVTVVAVAIGAAFLRPPAEVVVPADKETAAPTFGADWKWLSASGIEVPIPKTWSVGNGCSEHIGPWMGPRWACDRSQAKARPMVQIGSFGEEDESPAPGRPIVVDGRDGTLTTTLQPNGRTEAILEIGGRTVVARMKDTELLDRIIHGIRFVRIGEVDHAGCSADRPLEERPQPVRDGSAERILPGRPSEIRVCKYDGGSLSASTVVSGAATKALVSALENAPSGPNPDDRDRCSYPRDSPIIVVARYAQGPDVTIYVWYAGCADRRMDNGAHVVQVTKTFMHAALGALGSGAIHGSDLPD